MRNFELELQEYILNYCNTKNISIDIRFQCFGDVNKFYTNGIEFAVDCVNYGADDFEDIKKFFVHYVDIMWKQCRHPMNRIALYVENIIEMDGLYEIIVGGGLFEDEELT